MSTNEMLMTGRIVRLQAQEWYYTGASQVSVPAQYGAFPETDGFLATHQ
jgi:hypothetical protein